MPRRGRTCANIVKCNKPNWTCDATGNQTDYLYHPTTGQLARITQPTGNNGLRPQTDFSYENRYAWYKNAAGNIVQAPTPISVLTRISRCTTAQCHKWNLAIAPVTPRAGRVVG